MISDLVVSETAVRVFAALVNFGVATAAIIYLRIGCREMRWSRSLRRLVTRDALPYVYWVKMGFAVLVTLFTIALGVLLLIAQPMPWN